MEEKTTQLLCWDCGQEICKGEDFMPYYEERGNCTLVVEEEKKQAFVKCRACHTKDPQLHFQKCEVFSRIVGYIRPIQQWNPGKTQEWKDRVVYKVDALGKRG